MKEKECPACAMQVKSNLKVCPICGYELSTVSTSVRWTAIILVLLFLYLIFAYLF